MAFGRLDTITAAGTVYRIQVHNNILYVLTNNLITRYNVSDLSVIDSFVVVMNGYFTIADDAIWTNSLYKYSLDGTYLNNYTLYKDLSGGQPIATSFTDQAWGDGDIIISLMSFVGTNLFIKSSYGLMIISTVDGSMINRWWSGSTPKADLTDTLQIGSNGTNVYFQNSWGDPFGYIMELPSENQIDMEISGSDGDRAYEADAENVYFGSYGSSPDAVEIRTIAGVFIQTVEWGAGGGSGGASDIAVTSSVLFASDSNIIAVFGSPPDAPGNLTAICTKEPVPSIPG